MTQHNYELVFATRPHMSEDESAEIKKQLQTIIKNQGGQLPEEKSEICQQHIHQEIHKRKTTIF